MHYVRFKGFKLGMISIMRVLTQRGLRLVVDIHMTIADGN